MANIACNGLDLELESLDDLVLLLKNEVYVDIDSEFATELQQEINKRKENI